MSTRRLAGAITTALVLTLTVAATAHADGGDIPAGSVTKSAGAVTRP